MVMPRRSASARSGRCGESGLTLMAVARFHGSMSRSRAAAASAPAKFGMRPCGGNGKRATPSAASLSQTHCRAVLLSPKSRVMTERGAPRPGDGQGPFLYTGLHDPRDHAARQLPHLPLARALSFSRTGASRLRCCGKDARLTLPYSAAGRASATRPRWATGDRDQRA